MSWTVDRRDSLKTLAGSTGLMAGLSSLGEAKEKVRRGLAPVKITDVRTILTQPGLGIDIDEKLAAKFPYKTPGRNRGTDRLLDDTIVRP